MLDINSILYLTNLTERFGAAINLAKANLLCQPDEAALGSQRGHHNGVRSKHLTINVERSSDRHQFNIESD